MHPAELPPNQVDKRKFNVYTYGGIQVKQFYNPDFSSEYEFPDGSVYKSIARYKYDEEGGIIGFTAIDQAGKYWELSQKGEKEAQTDTRKLIYDKIPEKIKYQDIVGFTYTSGDEDGPIDVRGYLARDTEGNLWTLTETNAGGNNILFNKNFHWEKSDLNNPFYLNEEKVTMWDPFGVNSGDSNQLLEVLKVKLEQDL